MKKSIIVHAILAAVLAAASTLTSAAPAHSWNLSRSMMTGFNANPFARGR